MQSSLRIGVAPTLVCSFLYTTYGVFTLDEHGKRQQEGRMPVKIKERTVEQPRGLFSLLSTIRWEAQFKLAKCCLRVSIAISDLGVFLAEPVLERSRASNGSESGHDEPSLILPNPLPPPA